MIVESIFIIFNPKWLNLLIESGLMTSKYLFFLIMNVSLDEFLNWLLLKPYFFINLETLSIEAPVDFSTRGEITNEVSFRIEIKFLYNSSSGVDIIIYFSCCPTAMRLNNMIKQVRIILFFIVDSIRCYLQTRLRFE